MNNIILFGTGKYGKSALRYYGREQVKCFVDNNEVKWGTSVCDVPVISFENLIQMNLNDYRIVIACRYYDEIVEQLQNVGIKNFELYSEMNEKRYYSTKSLVLNPYDESIEKERTEAEYNLEMENSPLIEIMRKKVDELYNNTPLFRHIEIETINRCNGICSFCPINSNIDPREKKIMSKELFERIINQLADMNYEGKIALFSNNEPMLDERIIDFHKYCRSKLPNAWMVMFTNGTLLTLDKFKEIIPYLDELVIDNYNQELKLIPNSKAIKAYCEEHEELKEKVTIVLRKPNEILSSRGGDAPNRTEMVSFSSATCVLPFIQMIVRPDGKVSLCCNDPLGKNTLGDLSKESVLDVWYGEKYKRVRTAINIGREKWKHCVYCDVLNMG